MSEALEKAIREIVRDEVAKLGLIYVNKQPPYVPSLPPAFSACPACGLGMKGPTGYVCARSDCPTFARVS